MNLSLLPPKMRATSQTTPIQTPPIRLRRLAVLWTRAAGGAGSNYYGSQIARPCSDSPSLYVISAGVMDATRS